MIRAGNPGHGTRVRRSKRRLLADAMEQSRLDSLLLRIPCWRGAVALTYHRIGDGSSSDLYPGVWSATADALDRQLQLIKRHFDLLDPHRLTPELLARRGRSVIVTFDDGYRDLYEVAKPVLEANGVRAVMFLCSGFIDGQATAWWDEIAWMLRRSTGDELPRAPGRTPHCHCLATTSRKPSTLSPAPTGHSRTAQAHHSSKGSARPRGPDGDHRLGTTSSLGTWRAGSTQRGTWSDATQSRIRSCPA